MSSHGQFCSIARALDVLGQRWMLLVVDGRREWVRAFPRWFERYLFARIPPVR